MKKNTAEPDTHLITGASILLKDFKTPANFLDFLIECTLWMDHLESDPNAQFHTIPEYTDCVERSYC